MEDKPWTDGVRSTTSGRPPQEGVAGAPEPIDPATGQHKSYYVLNEAELAKGFVRPVRSSYVHKTCGVVTRMGTKLAETYARDPKFYGSTFCISCGSHFPVAQFTWDGTSEDVGS